MRHSITVKQRGLGMAGILALGVILLWPSASAKADLRAYWAMDDGGGPTATDASAYSNDGTLVADTEAGSPSSPLVGTTPPNWIAGVNGGALEFSTPNGSNYNSVWVAQHPSLVDLGAAFSMSLWIRQDSLLGSPGGGFGYNRVLSTPNYEIELGTAGDTNDYFWPYGGGPLQTGSGFGTSALGLGVQLGTWYHMAVTYDGTDLKKYINGSLVLNSVVNAPGETLPNLWDGAYNGSYLKLGSQTTPNKDWFLGALDDVAIWGNAYLDEQAVAGLYTGAYSPLTAPATPAPEPTTGLLVVAAGMCLAAARRRST